MQGIESRRSSRGEPTASHDKWGTGTRRLLGIPPNHYRR